MLDIDHEVLLFDLDGLLVNTEELHYQAYIEMLSSHRAPSTFTFNDFAAIAHTSSDGLRKWLSPLVPNTPWETLYAEKQAAYLRLLAQGAVHLMPGAEEFLALTKHKKRAVATNSTKAQVAGIRAHVPALDAIPTWITREHYKEPKPAPDAYLAAYKAIAAPGDRALGFEDSLRGVRALLAAHFDAILICDETHPQMNGDIPVPHFPSFLNILHSHGKLLPTSH